MARPPKNNCDYFPHDRDMRNHKKVKAIRNKFSNGYAIWVMLLEHLTGSDGNVFPYTDLEFELMSGDFGFSATEIRDVVDYCVSLELLFLVNGFINSESLDERLAPVFEKRRQAKELSKQQQRENGKFTAKNTESSGIPVTEMPESKVKESKRNETKSSFLEDLQMWGNQIVMNEDHIWEQMRGRRVTQSEMDSFLSVAVRNKWKIDTQQEFRYTLKGFQPNGHEPKAPVNPGKLQ